MLSHKKKAELAALLQRSLNGFGRNFYGIYWHMHNWSRKKWMEDGWSDITTDHLKLMSLIAGGEVMTNGELAKRAGVSKQAMSQMVGLLEKRGALIVKPDPADSRAKSISISEYGVDFMLYFNARSQELYQLYTGILGEEKMRLLTSLSGELARGLQEMGEGGKEHMTGRK